MSIQDISNKIFSEAKSAAFRINKLRDEKLKQLEKEFKLRKVELEKTVESETLETLQENEKRAISSARQKARLLTESKKREVIDMVFEEVLKKFANLPEKDYKILLRKLVENVPANEKGEMVVPINREKETREIAKELGLDHPIKIDDDIKGGFKFVSSDFELDLTLEHLLKDRKQDLESEILMILFE